MDPQGHGVCFCSSFCHSPSGQSSRPVPVAQESYECCLLLFPLLQVLTFTFLTLYCLLFAFYPFTLPRIFLLFSPSPSPSFISQGRLSSCFRDGLIPVPKTDKRGMNHVLSYLTWPLLPSSYAPHALALEQAVKSGLKSQSGVLCLVGMVGKLWGALSPCVIQAGYSAQLLLGVQ